MQLPLFTAVDNNPGFIQSAVKLLKSVNVHAKDFFSEHVCAYTDLTDENQTLLTDAGWTLQKIEAPPVRVVNHVGDTLCSTWTKLLLPDYAKDSHLFYLDADTFLVGPIDQLKSLPAKMDKRNKAVAATPHRVYVSNSSNPPLVNVGVMLINASRWKEENWSKKLIEKGIEWSMSHGKRIENQPVLRFDADEIVFNIFFPEEEISYLNYKYNVVPAYPVKDPRIIHFCGPKPWDENHDDYLRIGKFLDYCQMWEKL